MSYSKKITVSAPGKIHLLGEHAVVYGKPALLAAVDLRVSVILSTLDKLSAKDLDSSSAKGEIQNDNLRKLIESILKRELKIKRIPDYYLTIDSQIPIGCGLGSSAAISVAYFGAMLLFFGKQWDLEKINTLAYEAEKVFHGNPSGGDNSTVCFGGLLWFQKISKDEKIIRRLPFSIPIKLARNFVLIDTGKPVETTGEMVSNVRALSKKKPAVVEGFLDNQEKLTHELLSVIKEGMDHDSMIRIIKAGEQNLESIGVVSSFVQSIMREIEQAGGAAKICGGGGKTKRTGMLLTYHKDPEVIKKIAEKRKLSYFQTKLGVEGLRIEE